MTDSNMESICKSMPDAIAFGAPNPLYYVCQISYKIFVEYARRILFEVEMEYTTLNHEYEKATMEPGREFDTADRVEDIHNYVEYFQKWIYEGLQTINNNVNKQHTEMRNHLQDRHQKMTHDI